MYRAIYCLSLALSLSAAAVAEPSDGGWLQLYQLNQANQQALERMQRESAEQRPPPLTPYEREAWQRLDRQQRQEQRALQRNQQHQLSSEAQKRRIAPPAPSQRLDGLYRQQRFRQTQGYQLQRFQRQQQMYLPPR